MEDFVVEFFASFFVWFLFLGLLILWLIDGKIKKEQVVHALFACVVAFLAAVLIKHFFPTIRPYILNHGETDVLLRPTDSAFPSEHTVVGFALAVTIYLHDKRVGWVFLLGAFIVGVARVMANVHWPIDIVGGAFLGTIVAVIVERIHFIPVIDDLFVNKKLKRKRKK